MQHFLVSIQSIAKIAEKKANNFDIFLSYSQQDNLAAFNATVTSQLTNLIFNPSNLTVEEKTLRQHKHTIAWKNKMDKSFAAFREEYNSKITTLLGQAPSGIDANEFKTDQFKTMYEYLKGISLQHNNTDQAVMFFLQEQAQTLKDHPIVELYFKAFDQYITDINKKSGSNKGANFQHALRQSVEDLLEIAKSELPYNKYSTFEEFETMVKEFEAMVEKNKKG